MVQEVSPLPGAAENIVSDIAGNNHQLRVRVLAWLRRNIVSLAGLLLAIAVIVGVFYFYSQFPGRIDELKKYGYLGAFIVSIVLNATLILPVSNMAVLMALGATMPSPILVGLVGGFGAAIGETTGYIAGRSGRGLVAKRRIYSRVEGWLRRWGWLTIFVLSGIPLFFDLVGIAAGALRFPFWRFILLCFLGRAISYILMVWLASLGYKLVPVLFS